jgi:hypothetical protein
VFRVLWVHIKGIIQQQSALIAKQVFTVRLVAPNHSSVHQEHLTTILTQPPRVKVVQMVGHPSSKAHFVISPSVDGRITLAGGAKKVNITTL